MQNNPLEECQYMDMASFPRFCYAFFVDPRFVGTWREFALHGRANDRIGRT